MTPREAGGVFSSPPAACATAAGATPRGRCVACARGSVRGEKRVSTSCEEAKARRGENPSGENEERRGVRAREPETDLSECSHRCLRSKRATPRSVRTSGAGGAQRRPAADVAPFQNDRTAEAQAAQRSRLAAERTAPVVFVSFRASCDAKAARA